MENKRNGNEPSSDTLKDLAGKYLTFQMAGEEYGIGILKIKEIIGMLPVTRIPKTPEFVKGVINLRGKVIPVIDLRLRFDIEPMEYTDRTCIIVVEIYSGNSVLLTGVVVDSVSEVLNVPVEEIEQTPSFSATISTEFLLGMAKTESGVKILLDVDRVLRHSDLNLIEEAA